MGIPSLLQGIFLIQGSNLFLPHCWQILYHLSHQGATTNLQHIQKQRHHFANEDPSSQSCGFSSSHVWMWELDHKEGWVPQNWCFQTVVLEKTLESSLVCKEIKLVNPKGNQPWIFIGRADDEAEAPIFWPPDEKSQLSGKDPDAGKDWRQKEKGVAEDEIVRQHHLLNGHEFEQTLGDSEGQRRLLATVHRVAKNWTWLRD